MIYRNFFCCNTEAAASIFNPFKLGKVSDSPCRVNELRAIAAPQASKNRMVPITRTFKNNALRNLTVAKY
jgi:hypothetical protein